VRAKTILPGLCLAGPGILALLLQAPLAAAPSEAVKQVCGAQIRSLCLRPWRFTPDAIASCVAQNRMQLSLECQGFWETAHMCQLEMAQVCGGLNPLTIKGCLANSRQAFSPVCQETLGLD